MKLMHGKVDKDVNSSNLNEFIGTEAKIRGIVHRVRNLGGIIFIILHDTRSTIQCVLESKTTPLDNNLLRRGNWLEITGKVVSQKSISAGVEIQIKEIKLLSIISGENPITTGDISLENNLGLRLKFRSIGLRELKEKAIFRIKDGIKEAFRGFLRANNFVEIDTPKIIFKGIEGGSKLFSVDYFGEQGYLSQSPQLYKQMMVGVFGKVFEVAPVFRANKNKSSRQLNEFIALDVEFGPIDGMDDVMDLIVALIRYISDKIIGNYQYEIDLLKANIPKIDGIPSIYYDEAKEIVVRLRNDNKIDASIKDEQILSSYAKGQWRSEFLFITHPPYSNCSFYVMEDKEMPGFGKSCDLLFRGLEIANGGQRIHSYESQRERMLELKFNIKDFEHYLTAHLYGLPPHGGFAISLERYIMKLIGLSNIREASLFPRDTNIRNF